ncbi:MAG: hypothetical protein AAF787_23875, partial [Chloroflexota bacterium]
TTGVEGRGGAVYVGIVADENEYVIADSVFEGNVADEGGAVYQEDGVLRITGSSFTANEARISGGGVFISDVISDNRQMIITSSTFTDNVASTEDFLTGGSAIYTELRQTGVHHLQLTDSVFRGHEQALFLSAPTQDNIIRNNCFIDNLVAVQANTLANDLNRNYWGASDGPSGSGDGGGDQLVGVESEALYADFLTSPPESTPACVVEE